MSCKCELLHKWFNGMKKHSFPFNEQEIPENGVYILFEKGEFAHSTKRIVRIGTHRGQNRLCLRLFEHFLNPNKDRSIFRKNIGRCLLNKDKDSFLEKWEIDLTTKKAKELYSSSIDFKKQEEIEKRVTKYIQDNFSFVVFRVDDKGKRIEIESKIISTVSLCDECQPSQDWFGFYCPNEKLQSNKTYKNCLKIKESGLWLVKGLYKEQLSDEDVNELRMILNIEN